MLAFHFNLAVLLIFFVYISMTLYIVLFALDNAKKGMEEVEVEEVLVGPFDVSHF